MNNTAYLVKSLPKATIKPSRLKPGFKSGRFDGRFGQRLDQVRSVIHSSSDSLPAVRARRMKSLWQVAEQGPLDVVIACYDFLWPDEVAELKRLTGAAIAMWFPETTLLSPPL